MSNERPDEFLSWRTLLNQPDALPEQGLDNKEAAWERLEPRLGRGAHGGKRVLVPDGGSIRRRLVYRYGIAAAFLLLALIPATRFFKGRSSAGNMGRSSAGKQVFPAAGQRSNGDGETVPGIVKRDKTPPVRTAIPGTDLKETLSVAFGERQPLPERTTPLTERTMPLREGTMPLPERTMPPAGHWAGSDRRQRERRLSLTTGLSIVADRGGRVEGAVLPDSGHLLAVYTSPVKKPLRVVSINEIDNPVVTAPAVTVHWPSVPFRIRQVPPGVVLRPETAVLEGSPALLKIKLNP